MRTVYRYEDDIGRGPYSTFALWDMSALHNDRAHPGWFKTEWVPNREFDKDVAPDRTYRAGTDSKESLLRWFDGYNERLVKHGFRITRYEVPDWAVVDGNSGLQLAFDPTVAVKV